MIKKINDDIYLNILQYYDIADEFVREINSFEEKNINLIEKEKILFLISEDIKKNTDILLEDYILFLKEDNMQNYKLKNKILNNLDNITIKANTYKNKIDLLYNNPSYA